MTDMRTIAALFVETDGIYSRLPNVEPWDIVRDARNYPGHHPVVAHPPCDRWCQMAPVNQARYGHKVGDDGGCFEAALVAVRRWGGVLEHPAVSLAMAGVQPTAAAIGRRMGARLLRGLVGARRATPLRTPCAQSDVALRLRRHASRAEVGTRPGARSMDQRRSSSCGARRDLLISIAGGRQ